MGIQFFRRIRIRIPGKYKYLSLIFCEETSFGGGLCTYIIYENVTTFTFLYSLLDIKTVIPRLHPNEILTHIFSQAFSTRNTFFAEFLLKDHVIPDPRYFLRPMTCNMDTGILYIKYIIESATLSQIRDTEIHIDKDHSNEVYTEPFLVIVQKQKKALIRRNPLKFYKSK